MNKLTKGLLAAMLLASPLVGAEPQYPADFKPEVLYQDAEYIAKHSGNGQAAAQKSAPAASSAASEAAKPAAANADDLSHNYIVGVFIVGLLGLMIWSSRQKPVAKVVEQVKVVAAVAGAAGETGVAKYLKSIGAGAETGVAKYLKTVSSNVTVAVSTAASSVASTVVSETGVAKYLKTLDIPAKGSAAATGVAKYLRDRGN